MVAAFEVQGALSDLAARTQQPGESNICRMVQNPIMQQAPLRQA